MSKLTHFDPSGQAHMVDVGDKQETHRVAVAAGRIVMQASTLALVLDGGAAKGDVLGVARIAAIQAAKRTGDRAQARSYYEKLVALAGSADTVRPDLVAAKQYLAGK